MAEAIKDGVEEDESKDDGGMRKLNAFEIVAMFGGMNPQQAMAMMNNPEMRAEMMAMMNDPEMRAQMMDMMRNAGMSPQKVSDMPMSPRMDMEKHIEK